MIRVATICVLLAATACAPVPMTYERAEALCREDIRGADGVSGNVGIGVGSGGGRAKGSITIDNRVFNPQSQDDYLADCIARRVNGEPQPTQFGITIGAST